MTLPSIGAQVRMITGLLETNDLTDWEEEFTESIKQKTTDGKDTRMLSEKQIVNIERIYKKHFA